MYDSQQAVQTLQPLLGLHWSDVGGFGVGLGPKAAAKLVHATRAMAENAKFLIVLGNR
jgi:hypothetical protein